MKKEKRWLKSAIATAAADDLRMPWARGPRKPCVVTRQPQTMLRQSDLLAGRPTRAAGQLRVHG